MKIRCECSFVFGKTTFAVRRMHKRSQVAFLFSILSRIVGLNRARRPFAFLTSNHRRMDDSLGSETSFRCCWVDNALCGTFCWSKRIYSNEQKKKKKLAVGFPNHILFILHFDAIHFDTIEMENGHFYCAQQMMWIRASSKFDYIVLISNIFLFSLVRTNECQQIFSLNFHQCELKAIHICIHLWLNNVCTASTFVVFSLSAAPFSIRLLLQVIYHSGLMKKWTKEEQKKMFIHTYKSGRKPCWIQYSVRRAAENKAKTRKIRNRKTNNFLVKLEIRWRDK